MFAVKEGSGGIDALSKIIGRDGMYVSTDGITSLDLSDFLMNLVRYVEKMRYDEVV